MLISPALIVFGIIFSFITVIFYVTPANKKFLLYLISFPFVIFGYLWSDFFAYTLTETYNAIPHSVGLGTVYMLGEIFFINIQETWILALYLIMFVILESQFFYAGWKIGDLLIPELVEELHTGKTKKERYLISIMVVIPLQFVFYMFLGGIWASLHFPSEIIVHMFLSLIFSIPVSMYAVIKTRSMFPLLLAWILYDLMLVLWL